MTEAANFEYLIQWNTASTSTDDNVTGNVLVGKGVSVQRGVQQSLSPIPEIRPASASVTLDNAEYTYHPESTGSPISGGLVPGRQATFTYTSPSTGPFFKGRTTRLTQLQDPDDVVTRVDLAGPLNEAQKSKITTPVYNGIKTGDAIGVILDLIGFSTSRRELDGGATVMPLWFLEDKNALDALRDIQHSEGPGAAIFENANGDIVFHDRHRRLTQTNSKVSQATWRNGGTAPLWQVPLVYDDGWDSIVNSVVYTPRQFTITEADLVWNDRDMSLPVPASGGAASVTMVLPNPMSRFTGFASFGEGVENLGVSFDQTTGPRITVNFTNASGTDAIVTEIQLYGELAIESTRPEAIIAESTASQDEYGLRSYIHSGDTWMGISTARDLAAQIINDYDEPIPRISVPMTNLSTDSLDEIRTREVNDLVTVIDTRSGMNREFYVDSLRPVILDGGKNISNLFELSGVVPSPLVGSTDVFILDSVTQGVLDTNKLGV